MTAIPDVPPYNAAAELVGRNLAAGRGDKIAYIDDDGQYTFKELMARVQDFAGALRASGVQPEQRVMLCLEDSIDFPVAFLGAIWAGVVPVPVNTLLTRDDYRYMLCHSGARIVFVSQNQLPVVNEVVPEGVRTVVSAGDAAADNSLRRFLTGAPALNAPHPTSASDMCFWLYSSGSTGRPKGVVHAHGSLMYTAEHFAQKVLGIGENDVVFSASKLFFAYGLGNGLSFPLSVGATAILSRRRPTPAVVFEQLLRHRPTIFCAVPTLFAAMLSDENAPARDKLTMRICTSAGEGLPRDIGERWKARYGSDILDGIGSTEMLHIFLSNRPGKVRYGTTGTAVEGYQLRLVGDDGRELGNGELGDLYVKGDSGAIMYWADRERSATTFVGEWTRTGDKFLRDDDGFYVYGGRSDDMLKVGGIYVSPFEIESALIEHPEVLEAAVVGCADDNGLIKPKAYVVPARACDPAELDRLREALRAHVKSRLAPFKTPRWVDFVDEMPKTATGKIQRFKLRGTTADGTSAAGAKPSPAPVSA